jgi:hypothetical protein
MAFAAGGSAFLVKCGATRFLDAVTAAQYDEAVR